MALCLTLLTLRGQTGTQGCETFSLRDGCAFPDFLAGGSAFFFFQPMRAPPCSLRAAQPVSSVWRLPLTQVLLRLALCGTLWVPPLPQGTQSVDGSAKQQWRCSSKRGVLACSSGVLACSSVRSFRGSIVVSSPFSPLPSPECI